MNKDRETHGDIEIMERISNLVVTMICDPRIPISIRNEYRKTINKDMKIIPLMAYDLIQEYKAQGKLKKCGFGLLLHIATRNNTGQHKKAH